MVKSLKTRDNVSSFVNRWRQLFLDNFIIESMFGEIYRTVKQPLKDERNPILRPEYPWEGRIVVPSTVIFDDEEEIFKMWYQTVRPVPEKYRGESFWGVCGSICYATSEDGVEWEKPFLNIVEFEGSKRNNIVYDSPRHYIDYASIIKDLDETDPEKRYKMTVFIGESKTRRGLRYFYSPDGVNWKGGIQLGVYPCDDTTTFLRDPVTKRYLIYTKRHDPRRVRVLSESDDLIHWTPPKVFLEPDGQDPWDVHLYFLSVDYYEGIYLGLLGIYHTDPNQDTIDVQLAMSRNGRMWERVGERSTFIPLGPKGSFDEAIIYVPSHPMVLHGDEIIIYYGGLCEKHESGIDRQRGAIGRAVLRRDGFVSLESRYGSGGFTTKPFIPEGSRRLLINAKTQRDGTVTAEILDEKGKVIPGFSRDDSIPFKGDSVHHLMRWRNKKNLTELSEKTIKIRFYLERAELYAFSLI